MTINYNGLHAHLYIKVDISSVYHSLSNKPAGNKDKKQQNIKCTSQELSRSHSLTLGTHHKTGYHRYMSD